MDVDGCGEVMVGILNRHQSCFHDSQRLPVGSFTKLTVTLNLQYVITISFQRSHVIKGPEARHPLSFTSQCHIHARREIKKSNIATPPSLLVVSSQKDDVKQ